jgi:hypothetical protein
MAIYFPDTNLPPQSQDWTDKVENEIKKLDKRPYGGGGGDSGTGEGTPGPQGPAGPTGPQGAQGPQGDQGLQGIQGEQGIQGIKGDTGDTGPQGIQGVKGDTGLTGAKGDTGLTGATGAKGDTGDTGAQGIQGIQGIQGEKGDTGLQGIQGIKGDTGDTGPQGIQGVKGDTGNTGATGATGSQGPNGFSAYQVAQIEGFTGTEAEWLASLVGDTGPAGPGVAAGGTAGQVLAKVDGTDYNTYWTSTLLSAGYTSVVKHEVKLGESIAKGQAVYVSSADGTNMIVSKASNAAEATSSKTMGLLESGGSTNAKVNVITEGLLAGLDTSTATVGDAVWLGTNGNLIFWHYGGVTTKPVAPDHLVFIGVVTRVNANNGEIFVKVQNGFELNEIHDVTMTGKQDGYVLSWNATSGLYEFVSPQTGPTGATGPAGPTGATGPQGAQGIQGLTGATGPAGANGTNGTNGTNGAAGAAATIAVGTVTGLAAGATPTITNSGTSSAATFNFGIPAGATGTQGIQGIQGATGATGSTGATGPSGVIAVTSPITNSGTSTSANIGINQTLISIANSQVTGSAPTASPVITTSLGTTSTSFDLLNTAATTINFGGAASTLNIGKTGLGNTVTIGNALSITGRLLVGGGNGNTGLTVEDTGELLTDGAISASGTVTGGNLTTSGSLTRTTLATGSTTTASINGSGQFVRTSSSERYKQDIEDAEFIYEDVLALAPKTFRLKEEAQGDPESKIYGGLLAEDVDQIDSLKVFVNYMTNEDGSVVPDGIAYGEMVSALVSALKHQNVMIKSLEARIEQLEN